MAHKAKPKAKAFAREALSKLKDSFTQSELDVATKAIEDASSNEKEKRRLEASMTYYLKQSGELEPGQRLAGQDRQQFILLYMARQAREKDSVVRAKTMDEIENTSEHDKGKKWMGLEQMKRVFGEARVKRWMDSGKLPRRPDPIIGDSDSEVAEFAVPQEKERTLGISRQKVVTEVEAEGDGKNNEEWLKIQADKMIDMASEAIPSMAAGSKADGAGMKAEGAGMKEEGAGSKAERAAIIDLSSLDIMKDTKAILMKIKAAELQVKVLRDDSAGGKYADALHNDLKDSVGKFGGVVKAVEKLLLTKSTEGLVPTEVARLDSKVKGLMDKYDEMTTWANKLGILASKKTKTS